MRIASLEPFLTQFVSLFDLTGQLVGISGRCVQEKGMEGAVRLTDSAISPGSSPDAALCAGLAGEPVDLALLKELSPDLVLTAGAGEIMEPPAIEELRLRLANFLGNEKMRLGVFAPRTLEQIYDTAERVGVLLGAAAKGREKGQRMKAQCMDWADNFYDRTKNKRVTFLSGLEPLRLGGLWIPDLIHLTSAVSQVRAAGEQHEAVQWKEIVAFRPDVIIVAPQGMDLGATVKSFKALSALPGWDEVPAVVRGEVIFSDGDPHFYTPTTRLIDSMAILISAIAGFDSGYITPRDSFYRLRWLELHRHRL